jgi:hypothetical protein
MNSLLAFLGALTKLQKATISFVISIDPSVHIKQLNSHRKDFDEISYLHLFRKSVKRIPVSIK